MRITNTIAIQERHLGDPQGIQIACDQSPDFGVPLAVAPGVWWVRLPLATALQAVNVYLLEDGKGLTLVDTGVRSAECRDALNKALSHPNIESLQLNRVIVTHFHPDHMGLAGEFARDGVELWTSRTAWLNCQLLSSNKQLQPLPSEVLFMQSAGLTGIELEAFRRRAANRYNALVAPPPDHYVPLVDSQLLSIGHRTWRVAMTYGHAAEHISLWNEELVISGDQILPSISSNLTVPYTECDVDVIGEWLRSCRSLMQIANNEALCLPGHQRPFYGTLNRLKQIEENIRKTLERLQSIATQSTAAIECVEQVYGRAIASDEKRVLLPEIVGMLNHLYFHGVLERSIDADGVFRYTATNVKASRWVGRRSGKTGKGTCDIAGEESHRHRSPLNHAIPIQDESEEQPINDSGFDSSLTKNAVVARLSRMMILAAMCLIGLSVYWKWDLLRPSVSQFAQGLLEPRVGSISQTPVQAAIVPVETFAAVTLNHAEIPRQFTGVVKPRRASQIGFNRIGVIEDIFVERGERVDADTIIAQLNTNLLQSNLKAVKAQYRAAEAKLSELIAGPRAQTIDSARTQVASAKVELDLARNSMTRAQRLVNIGAVSQQDLDTARTNAAARAESLKSAEHALDELLEGTRSEQVLAQQAQLAELEAAQEQIQVQLEESVLRAPFDAKISDRFVEPGAVTSPGAPAFRLIDSESPEVWIGLPPEFLSTIQHKSSLELTIGDQIYTAKIKAILPELDETTRTNTVILELLGSDLDHSLFGQVAKIDLSRKFDLVGFWVPLSALTEGDQGLWALLSLEPTDDDETYLLERCDVEVIQIDTERAFVRGTIDSGTQLVTEGVRRLTPGQKVKLKTGHAIATHLNSDKPSFVSDAFGNQGAAK
jgi:glyoxylase-like metal-dependent hydrolase (beta-lactamase superfamily II)/multidrug efflux pump subunit AcrA (membrane-fusion protein)